MGAQSLGTYDGRGVLGVWHLDVGQGDSTLVHLPNHTWMLVDGGGASWPGQPDPGRWAVASALRALGVTKLSLVVLTHPHPDHMNGLKHVLEAWPVGTFWRNEDAERSPLVADLDRLVRARGGIVGRPPSRSTWGGVNIEAFLPLVGSKASVNDKSIVLRLAYRQRSLLLMGDAEKAAEAHLAGDLLASDILKVGHHGSRTSSTKDFLARIAPVAAVISCGAQNRFGHPHPSTLDALRVQGSHVLRTDEAGALHLRTDGVGGWTVACRGNGWRAQQIARWQGSVTARPK
jgi:competence protein ComEC